ncbi:MAG: hypothetical protein LBR08_07815 [Bacteroidales bacterium]|jgi:hypothetical protein|nr:hypothetical protein [Bacteroidales bacterium]
MPTDDMEIIGYQDPDFVTGMTNTFKYGGFTFSFFLTAVHGVTRYTDYLNTYSSGTANMRKREWWTPENPINTYPANRDDSNYASVIYFGKRNDASYLRLNDVTLSYQLPGEMLKKLKLNRLEVFFNAKNLATFTSYIGLDPEITSDYSVPLTRSYIFGLRVGL